MKIFISWSGDRSRAVAEILDVWLRCVIQALDPWLSSKNIDRGAFWFPEISNSLATTSVGIICLTQDNKTKPWILFEAGALARGLSTQRVCTFLVDLQPSDVDNPLAQFQHTIPTEASVLALLRTINSTLGEAALRESVLETVFATYWPKFIESFDKALEANPATEPVQHRSDVDILSEILTSVRAFDRRLRDVELLSSGSQGSVLRVPARSGGATGPDGPPRKNNGRRTFVGPDGSLAESARIWIRERVRDMALQGYSSEAIFDELGKTLPSNLLTSYLQEIFPDFTPPTPIEG